MNEDVSLLSSSGDSNKIIPDKNEDESLLVDRDKEEEPAASNDEATLGENVSPPAEHQINDIPKHTVATEVNCALCQQLIPEDSLTNHIQTQHSEGVYETEPHIQASLMEDITHICAFCGNQFGNATIYKEHVTSHGPLYQCGECGELFTNTDTLYDHMGAEHNENSQALTCDKCPFECGSPAVLNKHKLECHVDHKCFQCDNVFTSEENLNKHFGTHHSKEHPCNSVEREKGVRCS